MYGNQGGGQMYGGMTARPNMVGPSQQDLMQMMMNRMWAIKMAQQDQNQYEQGLPANMQWADAQRRATNAGTDFKNTVMTPEMAKAKTATSAGGLGASTSSFAAAKQSSLKAALMRQQQGVQNDAESSAIQQIGMMRGGTMQGPQNAQSQFQGGYSDPYSQSGYKNQFQQQPSGFDKFMGTGIGALGALGSFNQQYPQFGQFASNVGHGIGGWLGSLGQGSGGGTAQPQPQPFGRDSFSPGNLM